MVRTAKRIRFHHSRPAWQLAALLLAALICLPSIPLAQSPPSTPASVTVTRTDGALTATWPAGSGATKYHVTYSTDGGGSWHAPVDDHTNVPTNTLTFGADNAKTYIVGVRAGNDDGWSGWRDSPAAGPYTPPNANPPGPVASVSLTRADGTVTATWSAPSGATKYHVTYTTDNGTSWSLAALSHTTTSLTINAADNAKTYIVGVRAGNDEGWSGWVNSPASGPYTPPPAAPTGLTAAAGDESVTLAWSDPADASITGYEYALQPAGNDQGGWTGITGSDAATTSYIATGLTNDTAYTLHLRAVNAGGDGAAAQATATPEISGIVVQDSSGNPITALSIPEGDEVSYQVKLSSRPKADVTMEVNLADRVNKDPDIRFKGQASHVFSMPLTFTPASWNTPQPVTLVAVEDDDAENGARDVLHAARAYAAAHVEFVATEIDNDPSLVLQDGSGNPITALSVPEGGEASYQVKLSSRPNADVTMNVNLLEGTNDDTDVTFKGRAGNIELTFTPENWNTAQPVTLAAAEDADAENGARNVDHSARMYTSAKATLPVTESDNDEAGIIVQDGSGNAITALAVPEGGEASYQVKLASRPAQDVEVCIGLSVRDNNDADITFKGQASGVVALKLTFTPETWNTAQTVTLLAAEDDDDVNGARAVVNDARDYFPGEVALTATEIDNDQLTVTATRGNDGDIAGVSWTAYAGDDFEYYRVIVCNSAQYNGSSCSGTVFRSGAIHDADATGPVTATGLNAGTGYGIILQVWRNGSALKRHATLPALDVPAAPSNLSITPGDGYLDIAWDAVSDATGYDVRAKKAGAADWHAVERNVTGTSYRYTTTETIDYVAVRAWNANGPGPWAELSRMPASDWLTTVQQTGGASAQSASMASGQAQNQLAAPTWGTITRDNGRKHVLYLNWTSVTGASGYNVVCSHSDGWIWWQCGSITSQSTTTLTVNNGPNGTDLSRERSYKVAVRAVNSNPSQASNWTNSENIRPVFRWLHDLTYTRADGQITLRWTPNFWTTGYQIDCAVAESGKVATYTRCATLTGQDDNAAQHSVTIPHSTNSTYTVDDTKTYDIRITNTNEWDTGGNAQMFAPLV